VYGVVDGILAVAVSWRSLTRHTVATQTTECGWRRGTWWWAWWSSFEMRGMITGFSV